MATPSRLPVLILTACFFAPALFSQSIGINNSGQPPHGGAILDVSAGDKGVLLPRTTMASITNPTDGMIIFDTDTQQFHYYKNGEWAALLEEGQYQFWFSDKDGDGYGYPFNVVYAPNSPQYYVSNNQDCDDTRFSVHPGADEICDMLDNDCDGLVDDDDPDVIGQSVFYADADGDSYGNPSMFVLSCFAPEGYVANFDDCDDSSASAYPGAPEVCDALDNDCDDLIDESDPDLIDGTYWYPDSDEDGFGDAMDPGLLACDPPAGYIVDNTDCNDSNEFVYPGAPDVCDAFDNDCDGVLNEDSDCDDGFPCTTDTCNPMFGCENPVAPETCYIMGICYTFGEQNPFNECQVCNPNSSQTQWSNAMVGAPCGMVGTCDGNGNCN